MVYQILFFFPSIFYQPTFTLRAKYEVNHELILLDRIAVNIMYHKINTCDINIKSDNDGNDNAGTNCSRHEHFDKSNNLI